MEDESEREHSRTALFPSRNSTLNRLLDVQRRLSCAARLLLVLGVFALAVVVSLKRTMRMTTSMQPNCSRKHSIRVAAELSLQQATRFHFELPLFLMRMAPLALIYNLKGDTLYSREAPALPLDDIQTVQLPDEASVLAPTVLICRSFRASGLRLFDNPFSEL